MLQSLVNWKRASPSRLLRRGSGKLAVSLWEGRCIDVKFDTKESQTCQCEFEIHGERTAELARGRKAKVPITEPIIVEILGRDTLDEAMVLGEEVLIGQAVLESWTCSWTAPGSGSFLIRSTRTSL